MSDHDPTMNKSADEPGSLLAEFPALNEPPVAAATTGADGPAPIPLTVPQPGIDAWHDRLRVLIAGGYTAKSFGPAHGIKADVIQKHAGPNHTGAPSLGLVYALSRAVNPVTGEKIYPVAQQLLDLFRLEPLELEIAPSAWAPRLSPQRLLDGLKLALGWAYDEAPSAYEIAETVQRSCHDSGDIDRWRTHIFDIRSGYHFPYLSAQAIEFRRWPRTGPDSAGVEAETDLGTRAHEFIDRHTRNVAANFEPVLSTLAKPMPKGFLATAQVDEHELDRRWRAFRLHRSELILRMGSTFGASPGEWVSGRLLQPLLGADGPELSTRQLWVTPVAHSSAPSDAPMDLATTGVTTVVFVGLPGIANRRIAFAVARALGWGHVSSTTLANRITGRRVSVATRKKADTFSAVFEEVARNPMPSSVVAIHMDNMFRRGDTPRHPVSLLHSARRMLTAPGVLPVLLVPRLGSQSLDRWEARQVAITLSDEVPLHNQAAHCERLADDLRPVFGAVPGALVAEVQPSFPWVSPWNPLDPTQSPHAFYVHPLVGDLTLRVAYEIAHRLREGTTRAEVAAKSRPRQDRLERMVGFAAGSVVARYERDLMRCSVGAPWTDDAHLDDDGRYLAPPAGEPRRGTTVSFVDGEVHGA